MLRMNHRFFVLIAGLLFLGLGVLHGARVFYGWDAMIGPWIVPMWVSMLAVFVGFIMAIAAIRDFLK